MFHERSEGEKGAPTAAKPTEIRSQRSLFEGSNIHHTRSGSQGLRDGTRPGRPGHRDPVFAAHPDQGLSGIEVPAPVDLVPTGPHGLGSLAAVARLVRGAPSPPVFMTERDADKRGRHEFSVVLQAPGRDVPRGTMAARRRNPARIDEREAVWPRGALDVNQAEPGSAARASRSEAGGSRRSPVSPLPPSRTAPRGRWRP